MSGKSKVNKQMEQQQLQAMQQQNQLFTKMLEPTPEQTQFRTDSANWRAWKEGRDFSKAPSGELLNFNLWNPANVQKQQARLADLEGVGAAGLGGKTGSNSIALQMARERNANAAAEQAGAEYETAIGARNAYYEGNALPYAQFETSKLGGLLNDATQRSQFYTQARINTAPRNNIWATIAGGLLSNASEAAKAIAL